MCVIAADQTDISDDEDLEDDIPLSRWAGLHGDQINVKECLNIQQNVPTCEEVFDDNLINEFMMSRNLLSMQQTTLKSAIKHHQ